MLRSDIAARLAEQFPHLTLRDADACVDVILAAITDSLVAGGRVEIRGFGAFTAPERGARIGRNPRSGERVAVPVTRKAHFKPGKQLRESVNLGGHAPRRA